MNILPMLVIIIKITFNNLGISQEEHFGDYLCLSKYCALIFLKKTNQENKIKGKVKIR